MKKLSHFIFSKDLSSSFLFQTKQEIFQVTINGQDEKYDNAQDYLDALKKGGFSEEAIQAISGDLFSLKGDIKKEKIKLLYTEEEYIQALIKIKPLQYGNTDEELFDIVTSCPIATSRIEKELESRNIKNPKKEDFLRIYKEPSVLKAAKKMFVSYKKQNPAFLNILVEVLKAKEEDIKAELRKSSESRNYDMIGLYLELNMPETIKKMEDGLEKKQKEILFFVNKYRKLLGKNQLKEHADLNKIALGHSQSMKKRTEKASSGGNGWFSPQVDHYDAQKREVSVKNILDFSHFGENVVFEGSAVKAFIEWLKSNGHRKNIEGDFSHIGIALVDYPKLGKFFGTQIFVKED